jgi:hypothetical protein
MSVNQSAISTMLATSLAAVQAAIDAVDDISTASPFALQPVATAVASEIVTLQNAVALFDADIITTSVAGVVAGQPAPTMWAVLLNQASDSAQLATLLTAMGYLQRLATNLAQVAIALPAKQIQFAPIPPPPPQAGGPMDFSVPGNIAITAAL